MKRNKRGYIRIKIENESNLSTLADNTISKTALAGWILLIIILSVFLGALIVYLTPIHTFLPGYLKEDQRAATEENLLRLDSLRVEYETNQAFIDNYLKITDINRIPSDSLAIVPDSVSAKTETLLPPSDRERKFVERMKEQERFNISVLAPLAADGMIFSDVSDIGIFSSTSKESDVGEVVLTAESSVLSLADGTIIASYFSHPEKGYVIVIQHQRGFVSKYSSVGRPMVSGGEKVLAGQIIAKSPPADANAKRQFYIRIWHNALPVIPYKLIQRVSAEMAPEIIDDNNYFEAPRGK